MPDIEVAKTFYAGCSAGTAAPTREPDAGGYTMCFVDGVVAAAITPMWTEHATAGWSVYFASDDADASAAAVAGNGGQVIAPPMDVFDAGRMSFALDRSGHVRHLAEGRAPRDGDGYVPGAVAWIELVARGAQQAAAFYDAVFGLKAVPLPGGPTDYWLLHRAARRPAG